MYKLSILINPKEIYPKWAVINFIVAIDTNWSVRIRTR